MKAFPVERIGWDGRVLSAAEFSDRLEAAASAVSSFRRGADVQAVVVTDADGEVVCGWYIGSGGARVRRAG
jgi:hypothetical protein